MLEPPTRRFPVGAILISALLIGVATDLLFWESGAPGPNVLLWFVALVVAVEVVARRASVPLSTEARVLIAVATVFAACVLLRAAPYLQVFCVLVAAAAMALPALHGGAAWLRRSGLSDQIEAIIGAGLNSGLGMLRVLLPGSSRSVAGRAPSPLWGFVRGALLAVPFLIVFGVLLLSADPAFLEIVAGLVDFDLEVIVSHALLIGVFTWLAGGYLTGFMNGIGMRQFLPTPRERPGLGIAEVGTALTLVDLLFLAFVLVQFQYLFGGSEWVEATTGLTYAEYARQGFAELVLATALVLPSLLAADWILVRTGSRDQRIFRWLSGVQLVLLGLVVLSAIQRVRAYQDAYGLTRDRFLATVFLAWLVLVGIGFTVTVLRRRRERFAFPTLVSGFVAVAVLLVVDPDARIARANLSRPEIPDVEYLQTLSADAVPPLLSAIPDLPQPQRCELAEALLERWGPGDVEDWRGWNASRSRARDLVGAAAPRLREFTRGGCG